MGIGEFYALLSALFWAAAIIGYKYAGESMSANTLNLVKNVIGLACLLPTALWLEGVQMPSLTSKEWLILVVSGYFGIAVADSWYLQALRHIGAGRTAIIASLYSPFVVVLSIIFLGERLDWWKWSGFALVLLGILIVLYQRYYQQVDQHHLRKGLMLASASVFLMAAGVVAMKPILAVEGFFWIVSLRLLAGTVGLTMFLALRRQLCESIAVLRDKPHKWRHIIVASVFGGYIATLSWLAGFKYTDASIASVLNETANIFIVLLAWVFLNEQLSRRKLVGVLIAFAGVVVFISG